MTNPIGVNILSQYVKNSSALDEFLIAANPACVLVMDSPALAGGIHSKLPLATVIHRAFNANDAHWETATTPQAWLNANVPAAIGGVALALYNEPSPGDLNAFLTFLEQTCALCPANVPLALPNFAVGNPNEQDILNGVYDRILKLVCGTRHILALHEYFHDDPIGETPYLCGRYQYWLRRAKALHLPVPKIVITEHGRDIGGGKNDGWKGAGWSDSAFADRLQDAQEDVYAGNNIPVCIFSWGTGANNDWASFDIEDDAALQSWIIQWGKDHPMTVIPTPPPTVTIPASPGVAVPAMVVASGVRLRASADLNAAILRTLDTGEAVTLYSAERVIVSGYPFAFLHDKNGAPGWAAIAALDGTAWITVNLPDELWLVNLDVPFVTQLDANSAASQNDCGIASLLMLERYWFEQHNLSTPSIPSVDDLERRSPLAQPNPPHGLNFTPQLQALALLTGFQTQYVQPMTVDAICAALDAGKPVAVLLDYSVYNPASKPLAHILVVSGYNTDSFMTQDPYLCGRNVVVSKATLDAAMKSSPGNSIGYQGMVLA